MQKKKHIVLGHADQVSIAQMPTPQKELWTCKDLAKYRGRWIGGSLEVEGGWHPWVMWDHSRGAQHTNRILFLVQCDRGTGTLQGWLMSSVDSLSQKMEAEKAKYDLCLESQAWNHHQCDPIWNPHDPNEPPFKQQWEKWGTKVLCSEPSPLIQNLHLLWVPAYHG